MRNQRLPLSCQLKEFISNPQTWIGICCWRFLYIYTYIHRAVVRLFFATFWNLEARKCSFIHFLWQFSSEKSILGQNRPIASSCFMLATALIYIYLTNRFQVAVRLFSTRSQMTSKCGKNKKVAHEVQPSVSLIIIK